MDNVPNASSALLHYIDSLLSEDVASPVRVEKAPMASEGNLKQRIHNEDYPSGIAVDKDSMLVLLFNAAGVPLAIPLTAVTGIIPFEHGSSIRFISKEGVNVGLLHYQGRDIRILDAKDIYIFAQGFRGTNEA